ncbi:MAG: DUF4276 family protein [Bryobacteraceae bacterium]
MSREIRIYFEGDKSLKAGFDAFFKEIGERARIAQHQIRIVATGGNPERDFGIALRKHPAAWNILLRDSEGPHKAGFSTQVCERMGWPASRADSIFWMVEMMESWFHADKDALEEYYEIGFRKAALSANPHVEEISKNDLIEGLKLATKDTTKGKYHKTKHAPALLQSIKPALVRKAAPNCERLFRFLLDRL